MGRHARVAWVRERSLLSFPGLVPAAVGEADVVVGSDGTVQPVRVDEALDPSCVRPPPHLDAVRIAGDAFIGEDKKLALELSPLRYDADSHELLLARTLRVRIAFDQQGPKGRDGLGLGGTTAPPPGRSRERGTSWPISTPWSEAFTPSPSRPWGSLSPSPARTSA